MKKENKKLAQQRRAEERRRQEFRKKLKKFLKISLPLLAALILAIALVAISENQDSPTESGSSGSSTSSSTAGENADSSGQSSDDADDADINDSVSYSTDTSLTVADGDTVNIDYVGTVDGVEFDSGSTGGSGTDLVIGSGSYIDDFEEQLIGSHPGDTVEVNVTFPDPYNGNSDLSGKDAVFTVTVNGIYP